jgi:eukaryotic-like serine/threonine-protein kinase
VRGPNTGNIWIFSLDGEKKSKSITPPSSSLETNAVFSPDGRWLAYNSNEAAAAGAVTSHIFVQPFPPTGAKYQVSTETSMGPLWSGDGKQLFYSLGPVPMASRLVAVDIVQTQQGFSVGKASPASIEDAASMDLGSNVRNYDIAPNGKQFVVVIVSPAARAASTVRGRPQINVVLNWLEELKQRVPVK